MSNGRYGVEPESSPRCISSLLGDGILQPHISGTVLETFSQPELQIHARTLVESLASFRATISLLACFFNPGNRRPGMWLPSKLFSIWLESNAKLISGPWLNPRPGFDAVQGFLSNIDMSVEYLAFNEDDLPCREDCPPDQQSPMELFSRAEQFRKSCCEAYEMLNRPSSKYSAFNTSLVPSPSFASALSLPDMSSPTLHEPQLFIRSPDVSFPSNLGNVVLIGEFICGALPENEQNGQEMQRSWKRFKNYSSKVRRRRSEIARLSDCRDVVKLRNLYKDPVILGLDQSIAKLNASLLKYVNKKLRIILRHGLKNRRSRLQVFEALFGDVEV